jgi:hypothetical protein
MYAHSTDHRAREGGLVNRSFWVSDLPRPILTCRVFGHRPVVDGHGPNPPGTHAARWVCCDRCGIRPCPQGRLDPERWDIGARYTGPFDGQRPWDERITATKPLRHDAPHTSPGAWPARPTWTFGGQLVIGAGVPGPSIEVKVGNSGSDHTLAAHAHLGRLIGLYLHTEYLGTWLQRRLNPTGYESKVTGINAHDGRVHWQLWAPRDSWSATTPRWRDGAVRYNLADILLGERRYSYEQVGDPVQATLRMPHGDDHPVELQLERVTRGRKRGRRRTSHWSVDWECPGGIPTRPESGRGRYTASSARIPDTAVEADNWVHIALAAIAASLTADRARYGYTPEPPTSLALGVDQLLAAAADSEQATTQAMAHLTGYLSNGDPAHLNRAGQAQQRAVRSLRQITRTEALR